MSSIDELVGNMKPEQRFDDPVKVFDLNQLDRATCSKWLTYCAMRRTLAYFLALHPEIEPMASEIAFEAMHDFLTTHEAFGRSMLSTGCCGR